MLQVKLELAATLSLLPLKRFTVLRHFVSSDMIESDRVEASRSLSLGCEGRTSLDPAIIRTKETEMAKQTAEHHTRAAESHGHAQRHHQNAAKHHQAGNHEKAAHHAHLANGHAEQAKQHSREAAKSHVENYGNKE
jgi:hypothetical protein